GRGRPPPKSAREEGVGLFVGSSGRREREQTFIRPADFGSSGSRRARVFPTNPGNVTARADANRGLQAWRWAMLVAPFVPWYTLPIPLIVFPFAWFVGLPAAIANGRPPPVTGLITSTILVFLTLLLVITALLSLFSLRRPAVQPQI